MEFRDRSSANLVFASVLDHSRTMSQIAEEWSLELEKFSTGELDEEIDRLVGNKIMKEDENGLKAHLGSQSFRTELENHIEYLQNEDESEIVLDDLSSHYALLRSTGFRTKVLKLENIKKYYEDDADAARNNPLELIYRVLKVLEGVREPHSALEEDASDYR